MARILITMGLVILITGLLWPWVSNLGLGKLPGDIVLEKGKFKFYAPITTSLLLSILLSVISWLLQKL
ncbi:MAG: DUF2905 domain-containing protein [Bacteroidota bacterium]